MKTDNSDFTLRSATEKDIPAIISLIKELAEYEHLSEMVKIDEKSLSDSLFKQRFAEAIVGEFNNEIVAYSIFFYNFSTFLGKPGIYIEDIYVKPEFRKRGFGKAMLSYISKLAEERNCGRVEWTCLDWNQKSIDFYEAFGAKAMREWIIFRVNK